MRQKEVFEPGRMLEKMVLIHLHAGLPAPKESPLPSIGERSRLRKILTMVAVVLVSAWTVCAQTPATLTDLGATVPTPGSSDISQLSSGGNTKFPDTLNYYTDNQTDHSAGEPGQTFTTGSNAGGYALTSLSLKTAGLHSGGGSPGGSINYLLHIYSVAGGNVTLLATYISAAPVIYVDGDWLQWSGLSVTLSANAVYAYSFGKAAAGGGWDAIGVASGNPYPGGEIGLIPPGGERLPSATVMVTMRHLTSD